MGGARAAASALARDAGGTTSFSGARTRVGLGGELLATGSGPWPHRPPPMFALSPTDAELSEAWIEGDEEARWSSTAGHGPGVGAASTGSSLIEVPPGRRLPRHTDSAEETIVVTAGVAEVTVGDESERVAAGGIALVPAEAPHEVRSVGDDPLRFVAVYADADVVTRYEKEVQPRGSHESRPVA